MLTRMMRKIHKNQKGITGLETAIILIAFVVVAAVFAYTVLSAGVFSSEESEKAIYAGLNETQSALEIRGSVTAYRTLDADIKLSDGNDNVNNTADAITRVQFIVTNTLDGEAIDMTPPYQGDTSGITQRLPDEHTTVISLFDENVILSDCAWTVDFLGTDNGDYLLENNEKAQVTVFVVNNDAGTYKLGASGSTTFYSDDEDTAASQLIDTNHEFTLEVKPSTGAVLTIERTTPGYLDAVNDLL